MANRAGRAVARSWVRDMGILALGLVVALGLAACKDGDPLESVDAKGQEIVFWHQHQRERAAALDELVAQFNSTNRHGIQVVAEFGGEYGQIYNRLPQAFRRGTQPHLVVAYSNQAHPYYLSDWVVDLKPYMSSARWGLGSARGDYFEHLVQQDEVDGVQVAFPPHRSMEVLYTNTAWLSELGYEEPPTSWEAFAAMCRKAAAQPFTGGSGEASRGLVLDADASRLAAMVFSRGGDFMNEERTAYTLDTPETKASLRLLKALLGEGAAELVESGPAVRAAFTSGRTLFALRSSSDFATIGGDVEAGSGFAWEVSPPPYAGPAPVVDVYGASLAVCRTTEEQQLAAWLFIKWLTEPAQQAVWVKATNYFPVRRSTARQYTPYLRTAYELLDQGKAEPSGVWYDPIRRMLAEAMVSALDGGDMDQILTRVDWEANNMLAVPCR